jgi:hypothetical protein
LTLLKEQKGKLSCVGPNEKFILIVIEDINSLSLIIHTDTFIDVWVFPRSSTRHFPAVQSCTVRVETRFAVAPAINLDFKE